MSRSYVNRHETLKIHHTKRTGSVWVHLLAVNPTSVTSSVGSQSDFCDVIQLAGRNIMFSVIPLLSHLGLIDEVNSKRFPYSG